MVYCPSSTRGPSQSRPAPHEQADVCLCQHVARNVALLGQDAFAAVQGRKQLPAGGAARAGSHISLTAPGARVAAAARGGTHAPSNTPTVPAASGRRSAGERVGAGRAPR